MWNVRDRYFVSPNTTGVWCACGRGGVSQRNIWKGQITQPLARHVKEFPLYSASGVSAGNKKMSLGIDLYFERKSRTAFEGAHWRTLGDTKVDSLKWPLIQNEWSLHKFLQACPLKLLYFLTSKRISQGIYPKEWRSGSWRGVCTPIFIATLFTRAKMWQQPECILTDEQIKARCYLYTMECSSAFKKK